MLKKWTVLFLLPLFLAPAMAQGQSSFESEALLVDLAAGLYGASLEVSDLNLPELFSAQIDSANTGRYDVFIEVAHDPTGWKLLQWLIKNEQLLKLEQFKVQWDILQECADQSINLARESSIRTLLEEMGLESKRIFVRSVPANTVYIKVYVEQSPWVKPVDNNRQRIAYLEHDYSVMSGELDDVKNSLGDFLLSDINFVESKFALVAMIGMTTTRYMMAPEISGALVYRDKVMLRGNGFHGLFLDKERNIYGKSESTFDKGWGVGFGFKLNPLWLYVGVHAQCNTLSTLDLAGDNTGWFHGGELGLMLIDDNYSISLTGLYGDVKDYDQNLTDDFGIRFAVNVGNTWR